MQKVIFASDMHLYDSLFTTVAHNPLAHYFFLGDLNPRYRTVDDWHHELTFAIEQSQGLDKNGAINFAINHHPGAFFRQSYREGVMTRLTMHKLEQLYDADITSLFSNTSGNSPQGWSDAASRLYSKFSFDNISTTEDYLQSSRALRQQRSVDYEMIGDSMVITMPYDEDPQSWTLFADQLENVVKGVARNNPANIILATHEHINPHRFFTDSRPIEMEHIITLYLDTLKATSPHTNLSFVAGHLHRFAKPYTKDGVTYYHIGWQEGSNIMRLLELDPETGKLQYKDITIAVSEEELAFLDALVEQELQERGYLTEVEAQQRDRREHAEETPEEGEETTSEDTGEDTGEE